MNTAEQLAFNRGQKDGLVGTALTMLRIVNNTDKGDQTIANPELEKIRRVFLSWREFLISNVDAKAVPGEEFKKVLLNTDKILAK